MNLKKKLFIGLMTVSLVPLLTLGSIIYFKNKNILIENEMSKIEAIKNLKKSNIENYFDTISKQVRALGTNTSTLEALREFRSAFFNVEDNISASEKKSIFDYYKDQFGKKYTDSNNKDAQVEYILSKLSSRELKIQNALISANPSALGEKNNMTKVELLSSYSKVHEKFHPGFNYFLNQFGYYDIFLIDAETGHIVYTVFKELDFTTSLKTGPYANTGLARAYKGALSLNSSDEFFFDDFETYYPSYESAASFISTPIFENGKVTGVLAFQMPLAKINEVMNERSGLGKVGQSYIVGQDKKLRSDMHNLADFTIDKSFKENKLIQDEATSKGLAGESGYLISKDFQDVMAVEGYSVIDILGKKWAIVVSIAVSEALTPLENFKKLLALIFSVTFIIVIIIGYFFSNQLIKSVAIIVEALSKSAHQVQNSSQKLNLASEKLASSVDLQASSIQETISAVDEISAMSQNNTASAERAQSLSRETKESANQGKSYVQDMAEEISSITKSYDEIKESIKNNNQEFDKIKNVINGISEKTKVINDIVFQTKLLSFNASVEAARAGEHGKGFAVVAEEVGNLASMSGKSSNEISQMLAESIAQVNLIAQTTSANIESIVSQGQSKIQKGSQVAKQCSDQLDEILNSVNILDSVVQEVSTASIEQSKGISEINASMNSLDQATNETSQTSTIAANSSVELHDQSKSLRQSIEGLRALMGTNKKGS